MTSAPNDSTGAPRREWLLVVDDEAPICEFLTSGLESEILEAVSAPDATSALRLLAARKTDPLMVVVDVLMPGGVDGLTLVRKLRDRLPRTKIVLMSGHLNVDSWWPVDLRDVSFLAKPFRTAQVAALVEAARSEFRRDARSGG